MITLEHARKVVEVVDAGLCRGVGAPKPGEMCVEAAVCFAMGEPHGDNPSCVGPAVRVFHLNLNDAAWSSDSARAAGLREIAVAQLGSHKIDQGKFAREVVMRNIKQILPIALRACGLNAEADACEKASDLSAAKLAADSAASAAESAALSAKLAADSAALAKWARWAAESAALSVESAAESAAESAKPNERDRVLTIAACTGVESLRACGCVGVDLWDRLNGKD